MQWMGIAILGLLATGQVTQGREPTPPPCLTNCSTLSLTLPMVPGAAVGAWRATYPVVGPALFSGKPQRAVPHVKGELAEHIFADLVPRGWFEETGWQAVTPARVGRSGIDLLFVKLGPNGEILDTLVVESKYGTARLGKTAVGAQMSDEWVRSRMSTTGALYRKLAQEAATGELVWRDGLPPPGTEVIQLPLEKGRQVYLWQDRRGRVVYTADGGNPGSAGVRRTIEKVAAHCSVVGEGSIRYRATVAHYAVDGVRHKTTIGGKVVCDGPFEELPLGIQRSLRRTITRTLRRLGYSGPTLSQVVDECCRRPAETWRWVVNQQGWNARVGLGRHLLVTGSASGMATGALEMLAEYWTEGRVDLKRVGTMALVGTGMGMASDYAATQMTTFVARTQIGQRLAQTGALARIGGSVVVGAGSGMVVAGVFVPYAEYALGYVDLRTAHRSAAANVGGAAVGIAAGAGARAAAWWAVSTFGAASTGTAIASLSGAAATNATLAWFGGGSLAAGGLGAAGGATVLTGGTAIVGLAAGYAIDRAIATLWHYADLVEKRQLLAARIELVKKVLKSEL